MYLRCKGTKGFATNQEIKGCYNPIYRTLTTVPATTHDNTVNPIDFSTPEDFSKKSSRQQQQRRINIRQTKIFLITDNKFLVYKRNFLYTSLFKSIYI